MSGFCRFCNTPLHSSFVDLGMSPLSNAYLNAEQLNRRESFYPLHAYVCENCKLVQLEEFESAEKIFSDYAYFSSYSSSWLQHAKEYTEMMIQRFGINSSHQVIEVASNDGYLLQYFKQKGILVLGIEPAGNVAKEAIDKGVETLVKFFGVTTANEIKNQGRLGDLIIGNNVLAHIPDLNDFVAGLKIALADKGIITLEFPHLLQLMQKNQFDTIYHEHFSYFSLYTAIKVFAKHGLRIFDVEKLTTHGGSLRIFVCHDNDSDQSNSESISLLQTEEQKAGLDKLATYLDFSEQVQATKHALLDFMIQAKRQEKKMVGYGAPAKGNTLLNYCGIRNDFLDYTVDLSPHKQGTFLPGTHIPVYAPERLAETQPDYILILPWNLRDEIAEQLAYTKKWGCQLFVPIPEVQLVT